jgi:hypothetical protein
VHEVEGAPGRVPIAGQGPVGQGLERQPIERDGVGRQAVAAVLGHERQAGTVVPALEEAPQPIHGDVQPLPDPAVARVGVRAPQHADELARRVDLVGPEEQPAEEVLDRAGGRAHGPAVDLEHGRTQDPSAHRAHPHIR